MSTSRSQALLYRLSGDTNALHADQATAAAADFSRPILHGLCTLGIAARAIVDSPLPGSHGSNSPRRRVGGVGCGGDEGRLRGLRGRFTSPAFPGDELEVRMWRMPSASALRFLGSKGGSLFHAALKADGDAMVQDTRERARPSPPWQQPKGEGDDGLVALQEEQATEERGTEERDGVRGNNGVRWVRFQVVALPRGSVVIDFGLAAIAVYCGEDDAVDGVCAVGATEAYRQRRKSEEDVAFHDISVPQVARTAEAAGESAPESRPASIIRGHFGANRGLFCGDDSAEAPQGGILFDRNFL